MFQASRMLSLIQSDLCGPMTFPLENGNKYSITFIDDFTRMCYIYLLKSKSQSFDTFKNFHLWIKIEAQLNIGTLRTNNGGEYTSQYFKKYWRRMLVNIKPLFFIIHNKMVWQKI